MHNRDTSWDHTDRTVLLQRCVGLQSFGIQPKVELIRRSRIALANYIYDTLRLTHDDVVLDLGSGPGYIARHLAPKVKQLHCADISQDYLAMCQEETSDLSNVTCHLIPFADLSSLYDSKITAIYPSALVVHFNIYDVCLYLQEFFKLLPPHGQVWLDFKSVIDLPINDTRFQRHMQIYKTDRSQIVRLLQYQHPDIIENIAQQVGFTVQRCDDTNRPEERALDNHQVFILERIRSKTG
jgi:cyclopropane fatty-acyl-phospholipid synthase-like methyltransferase